MALSFSVRALRFSDGTEVSVPEQGVLVFVGPNNVGKSLALAELSNQLANALTPLNPQRVVTGVDVNKQGNIDDLAPWFDTHAQRREPRMGQPEVLYRRGGAQMALSQIRIAWSQTPVGPLAQFFSITLNADGRTNMVGSAGTWDFMGDEPSTPLQVLFSDPTLERELSDASFEAFGTRVFVNRYGGSIIHLQMGPMDAPTTIPPDNAYMEQLRRRPYVHAQGDGMKSFLGIMLTVITGRYPIVIIDEPEAFLHPPQARLLGRKLSTLAPAGGQVFLATHSADLLLGLLQGPNVPVAVVRLTRHGDVNPVALLAHGAIAELWSDPLLKYSNILDGLFHRGVVVCEADTDATFYAATLDAYLTSHELPATELQFTQCGGKDRVHVAISALRAVAVPVRAIADIDVLRDEPTLRRIVDALGGSWTEVASLRRQVDADLRSLERNVTVGYAREQISALLDALPLGGTLSKEEVQRIHQLIRTETGWDVRKREGVTGLSGDTYQRLIRLIETLAAMGLHVVPVGELERWYPPAAGKHGSAWLSDALRNNAHLAEAPQRFVQTVSAAFDSA